MSDHNQRAAVGQAYNLANAEALHFGKTNDMKFIVERFLYHLETARLFQSASPQELATLVDNPKFLELIKELNSESEKS